MNETKLITNLKRIEFQLEQLRSQHKFLAEKVGKLEAEILRGKQPVPMDPPMSPGVSGEVQGSKP